MRSKLFEPRHLLVLSSSLTLSACSGIQSALDPRGPAAQTIANLSWAMFIGAGLIFLLVVILLTYVLLSPPDQRRRISGNAFILAGGVVLPVIVLSVLLYQVFRIGADLTAEPQDPLVVEVRAHQWWWEYTYLLGGNQTLVTANELHIPTGRPIELHLTTADVIHTFWVPNLGGKRDMIPGITNTLVLEADRPGLFRGQCNEFCGAQHALMRLHVIGQPPGDFERWLQAQSQPARSPDSDVLEQGQRQFFAAGCLLCHSVRGTEARGTVGPDLTHFGSRLTIGAGTLRNTQANREAWILSAQHLKPESRMPNFRMDAQSVRALAAYLGSLE